MRQKLFLLVAVSIPLVFFLLLELGLRLFGYGKSMPLFINTPNSDNYILPDPNILQRYFATKATTPRLTMEANLLLKHKPKNGLRLFVQGGSTAAGYPYGLGASVAGMLNQRLQRSFPERYVEVVNTAMSSINSYILADFADELIQQQPDAILIYAGHNEYLGIFGVGSNYGSSNYNWVSRSYMAVYHWRLVQLLQQLIAIFYADEFAPSSNRTVMAEIAKHKSISYNSKRFKRGLKQFESNLEQLVKKYKAANIPVILSTVASNIKDQPPLHSPPLPDPLPSNYRQLKQLADSSDNANLQFYTANKALQLGETFSAKHYFQQALQQDLLRFRAPLEINQIIKSVARRHGLHLFDFQSALEKQSKDGLIGRNYMLEHLHPNLQGYFTLADGFYQQLHKHNIFGEWSQLVPAKQAWKQRPILVAEEYNGYLSTLSLMSDYPFVKQPVRLKLPKPANWQQQLGADYFKKKIDWLTMLRQSAEQHKQRNQQPLALKAELIMADALPYHSQLNAKVGQQLLKANLAQLAQHYFYRCRLEKPNHPQCTVGDRRR